VLTNLEHELNKKEVEYTEKVDEMNKSKKDKNKEK